MWRFTTLESTSAIAVQPVETGDALMRQGSFPARRFDWARMDTAGWLRSLPVRYHDAPRSLNVTALHLATQPLTPQLR